MHLGCLGLTTGSDVAPEAPGNQHPGVRLHLLSQRALAALALRCPAQWPCVLLWCQPAPGAACPGCVGSVAWLELVQGFVFWRFWGFVVVLLGLVFPSQQCGRAEGRASAVKCGSARGISWCRSAPLRLGGSGLAEIWSSRGCVSWKGPATIVRSHCPAASGLTRS